MALTFLNGLLLAGLTALAIPPIIHLLNRQRHKPVRWAAMRFGPAAELIHPDGDRVAPASELASELVGCEADRQLEVGRADGLEAVCADLVERSLPS